LDASLDPLNGLAADLVARLSRVRLVALDVDGTLTDGGVQYVEVDYAHSELMRFDVRDGQGLVWLRRELDVKVAWITGRGCKSTERRAKELGIDALEMNSGPKDEVLAKIQKRFGLEVDQTLAMGDDLPDLKLAARAAVFAAPSDARDHVRARADLITEECGGHGAVREVCEALLAAQGRWSALVLGLDR
jgi:3-deoxy-D-manno-octulosonate 8-phosphate phosphatase (KDO 8-P phosphatase)